MDDKARPGARQARIQPSRFRPGRGLAQNPFLGKTDPRWKASGLPLQPDTDLGVAS